MKIPLRCRCGAVAGELDTARGGLHVACSCDDCQAYARALGRPDVLDPWGGTDIFQTTPSQVAITRGTEQLRCLRLAEQGLLRWHTGCCATPIGNGLGQTYYDCSAPGTYTQAAAQRAADAWSPAGGLDSGQFCAGNCYARATATAAATWCYDGLFAGRVELNTISIAPLCPTSASPGWD